MDPTMGRMRLARAQAAARVMEDEWMGEDEEEMAAMVDEDLG